MRAPYDHGASFFRGNFNQPAPIVRNSNPGAGFVPPPRNNIGSKPYVPRPFPQNTVVSPGIGPGLPSSYQPPNPYSGPL